MAYTAKFMATNAHAFEHHELWARNVPAGVHSMCKMDQRVYCCIVVLINVQEGPMGSLLC